LGNMKMAQRLLSATSMQQWQRGHLRPAISHKNMCCGNSVLLHIDIHMAVCIDHVTSLLMHATKKGA